MRFMLPRIVIKVERWKWSEEYQVYVSNLGNFVNKHKRPIKQRIQKNGYMVIIIPSGRRVLAHRVVMKTWCPAIDMENLTIDHLNHNKRDNSVYNLEWVSAEENRKRANADFIGFGAEAEKKPLEGGKYICSMNDTVLYSCSSIDEMVRWGKKNIPDIRGAKDCTVRKQILKAISNKTLYAKIKWEYELDKENICNNKSNMI